MCSKLTGDVQQGGVVPVALFILVGVPPPEYNITSQQDESPLLMPWAFLGPSTCSSKKQIHEIEPNSNLLHVDKIGYVIRVPDI